MEAVHDGLTIDLDRETNDGLAREAARRHMSPAALAARWVSDRVAHLNDAQVPASRPPRDSGVGEDYRETLRRNYRPDDIVVLLVGESPPAGGTFFYEANSALFDAAREGFERAFGPMPAGNAFLDRFRDEGFWLYDVSQEPVNHKRGRPRKAAVTAGVERLTRLLRNAEPDFVVAVKTSLEGPVRQAAALAGMEARRVRVLPFPLYQWRAEFVREFALFLNGDADADDLKAPIPEAERLTLHEAMMVVLEDDAGGPLPARRIANEIGRRALYERHDGRRADYAQVLARARRYPERFAINRDGVRLTSARPPTPAPAKR